MSTIVDIHCHTFNADDLPVRGFLQKVAFHDHLFTDDLAALVDRVVQGRAPGHVAENARLDTLLGGAPLPEAAAFAEAAPDPAATIEADVDRTLAEIAATEPELLHRVGVHLASEGAPPPLGSPQEGALDWFHAARRAVRWAKIYGSYRLDNTATLLNLFSGRVDLAVPMLVDLGMGLSDTAPTTQRQQVELQEKISRLSLQGRLPAGAQGDVHGFVGFDPRRELRARRVGDIDTPLAVLVDAVTRYGFVGVKLYPPMGFLPLGNAAAGVPDGAELDGIMRELFAWCVAEQVPVTAHGSASNAADEEYATFGSPSNWALVLAEFGDLHVNLGHFGGTDDAQEPWRTGIARLAAAHPHVYADVGNHRIDRAEVRTRYLEILGRLFDDPATTVMTDRLMFGTDWFMLAILPEHDQFLDRYDELYRAAFGDEATEAFLGGTALRFLGFDDPANANAQRVRRRYAGLDVPDWLAAA
ncbi:MAG TPA: amidohydrolase family protein [Egicoccus sp.]|nr:amidohydrolase family protein [Egicoccus sp.]HSK24482.1 amidohydrolase family protein [Egicoccus sp.]